MGLLISKLGHKCTWLCLLVPYLVGGICPHDIFIVNCGLILYLSELPGRDHGHHVNGTANCGQRCAGINSLCTLPQAGGSYSVLFCAL